MDIFQSTLLGIVQGLSEFLPISSSAHLILVPWIFQWTDDGGLTFDVALHFGTFVALLIYFRKDWVHLTKAFLRLRPKHLNPEELNQDRELKMVLFIILATIPGAVLGLLLEKKAEEAFRSPTLVATDLAVMGVILWLIDTKFSKNKTLSTMRLREALMIGVAQGFALIPGVSRSGVTITMGRAFGFDRESAARFSFLLCMPIIAGACILKLRHLGMNDYTPQFITGILASAVSGYFVIGGLLKFLRTRSYAVFAIYRVAFGIFVWILALSRN